MFTLWLSKALLCPKRKGAMQQLWLRMEARQIAPAFNPERMVHRQRILRALTYVRNSFQKGTLDIFSGTVEVDEPYIGGQ